MNNKCNNSQLIAEISPSLICADLCNLERDVKRIEALGCSIGEITEPAITSKDILIVGSGSGESLIPVVIAKKAAELGARIVYIGSNTESTVAKLAALTVRIPVRTKLEKKR